MAEEEMSAEVRKVYTDPYSAVVSDIAAQLLLQKQRAAEVAAFEGDGASCPVDSINALAQWLFTIAKRHSDRISYASEVVHDTSTDEAQRILQAVAQGTIS